MHDLPAALIATLVGIYWGSVLVKLARVHRRLPRRAALNPRLESERRIWPVWIVVVAGWHILPILAANFPETWCSVPGWCETGWLASIRMAAGICAVGCCLATFYCWAFMGRHWSVVVVPGEHQTLLTGGPFQFVRHPIYSLSIQFMACSLIAVPTLPMLVVALLHVTLMCIKVGVEERTLAAEFGERWHDYAARTGRFLPFMGVNQTAIRQPPPAPKLAAPWPKLGVELPERS